MGNQAVEQYIWRDRKRFYRLAYSYVRNQEDALDIVSESIVKAMKNQRGLRDKKALRSWFYNIVVNTAYDFLSKNKRLVYTEDPVGKMGKEDRYEDIDLSYALSNLPDDLRTIIILRFFEDMKIEEIANTLDQNINTVKSRLYRALKVLKIEMTDEPDYRVFL
jgi:RNA polymerase sigma-70 factor (ECF subfamily)